MDRAIMRQKLEFRSGGQRCVAWHYPGTNGGCVVMAGGLAVTKEPATDLFAQRFNAAGFAVLAFDYRRLGESGGHPRLVVRIGDALDDWHAAIEFARTLPDVDPAKVALWAFSVSGGHVFPVSARDPELAAAIAQTPLVDAPAVAPAVARYSTPLAQLRLMGRGVRDALRGALGRQPLLVPLTGERGTVAMLSTPDAPDVHKALNSSQHPEWQQQVAARSVVRLACYRPGRHAPRVRCPLLVVVCDDDHAAPPAPAARAAARAPQGQLARLPGGHYAPFIDAHEQAVELQLEFLESHLLDRPRREHTPEPSNPGRATARGAEISA